MQLSASLKDAVALEIGNAVPEVQAVFAALRDDRVLHVWTIVPEYDRAVFRSVYAAEKGIIRQFEDLDFDFNVLPSHGRDPRTVLSEPGIDLAFVRT